jgi:hypothetical protein
MILFLLFKNQVTPDEKRNAKFINTTIEKLNSEFTGVKLI